MHFSGPMDARDAGIETVYQTLALSPALSISDNLFLGREIYKGRAFSADMQDARPEEMRHGAPAPERARLDDDPEHRPAGRDLSGGQRQGVAVARAAAFGSKVIIMDEPTAALGVKESRRVLELILDVKRRGMPIVLISHNMPHVFEVADRIHSPSGAAHRGDRPQSYSMSDAVAIMTRAKAPSRGCHAALTGRAAPQPQGQVRIMPDVVDLGERLVELAATVTGGS